VGGGVVGICNCPHSKQSDVQIHWSWRLILYRALGKITEQSTKQSSFCRQHTYYETVRPLEMKNVRFAWKRDRLVPPTVSRYDSLLPNEEYVMAFNIYLTGWWSQQGFRLWGWKCNRRHLNLEDATSALYWNVGNVLTSAAVHNRRDTDNSYSAAKTWTLARNLWQKAVWHTHKRWR
jgi:hypothetical protein